MLNVGITELLCFMVIAVLVLGPDKLPQAARFAGKTYSKIKRMMSSVQTEIDRELRLSELQNQMQQELQRIQQLEQRLNQQVRQQQQQAEHGLSNANTEQPVQPNLQLIRAKPIAVEQRLNWMQPAPHQLSVMHPQFMQKHHAYTQLAKSA